MKEVRETLTVPLEGLEMLAQKVLSLLTDKQAKSAGVLLLEGDLGAGKTTFTQTLAKNLAVSERVISPTFILKKSYSTKHPRFKKLVHVDAYRFDSPEEAKVLRLEDDHREPSSLIVIEWPSKIPYIKPTLTLKFKTIDEETRAVVLIYEKE